MGTGGLSKYEDGDAPTDDVVAPGAAHGGPLSAPHAGGMFDEMHRTGSLPQPEGMGDDLEDPPMTGDPVHVIRLTEHELLQCVIYGLYEKDIPSSSLPPKQLALAYRIVYRLMKRASLDGL